MLPGLCQTELSVIQLTADISDQDLSGNDVIPPDQI